MYVVIYSDLVKVANLFSDVFLDYFVIVPVVICDITAPVSCEVIEPNNVALQCFGYYFFFCELRCFLLHHGIVDNNVLNNDVR